MYTLFRVSFTGLIVISAMAGHMATSANIAIASESDKVSPTVSDNTQEQSLDDGSLPVNVNREFNLNIKDENIIKKDYRAYTSIGIGESGKGRLRLRIGAMVNANAINMHLHNITGRVRFYSNWERLQK